MPSITFTLKPEEVGDLLKFILEKTQVLAGLSKDVQDEVVKQATQSLSDQGIDLKRDNVDDPEMYKQIKTAIRDSLVAVMTNTVIANDPSLKKKLDPNALNDKDMPEEKKQEEMKKVFNEAAKIAPLTPTPKNSAKDATDSKDEKNENDEKDEAKSLEEKRLEAKNSPSPTPGSKMKPQVVADDEGNVLMITDEFAPANASILTLSEEVRGMGGTQRLEDEHILKDIKHEFGSMSPRPTPNQ